MQTLVASHEKVDMTGWMTDPRTDEVTAVSAEYMRSEWIAVDSATGRDLAMLERKFDATIEIGSQSDDDTLWVVGASASGPSLCLAPARPAHRKDHVPVLGATEAREGASSRPCMASSSPRATDSSSSPT